MTHGSAHGDESISEAFGGGIDLGVVPDVRWRSRPGDRLRDGLSGLADLLGLHDPADLGGSGGFR